MCTLQNPATVSPVITPCREQGTENILKVLSTIPQAPLRYELGLVSVTIPSAVVATCLASQSRDARVAPS